MSSQSSDFAADAPGPGDRVHAHAESAVTDVPENEESAWMGCMTVLCLLGCATIIAMCGAAS